MAEDALKLIISTYGSPSMADVMQVVEILKQQTQREVSHIVVLNPRTAGDLYADIQYFDGRQPPEKIRITPRPNATVDEAIHSALGQANALLIVANNKGLEEQEAAIKHLAGIAGEWRTQHPEFVQVGINPDRPGYGRTGDAIVIGGSRYREGRQNPTPGDTQQALEHHLQAFQRSPALITSGGEPTGVDSHAQNIAEAWRVPHLKIPALWDERGKGAGPERNALMIGHSDGYVGVRAPGLSAGTDGTLTLAKQQGKPATFLKLQGPGQPNRIETHVPGQGL